MGKHKRRSTTKKTGINKACHIILTEITAAYVFLMMVIYPLYFQNKYYNIGAAKWQFFSYLTFGTGILLIMVLLPCLFSLYLKHEFGSVIKNSHFSATDWFVFAYTLSVTISVLFSPYKEVVIWGRDGWHMGLVSQLLFALIYFLVSRCWKWGRSEIICYMGAAFLVFTLAVLMRFRIDPLGMYTGLEEQYIINFLTTIGQVTWYSSYMVLLLPPGVFAFWFYDHKYARAFSGIFTSVGFMTMITQNSDSAFIALGILFFVLFWISIESNKRFGRFLETLLLCLASFKFMGICQKLFPENAVPLGRISLTCSQGGLTWILLAAAVICLFCFRILEKKEKIDVSKIRNIRICLLILLMASLLSTVIYIYLNTTGRLPENLRSTNNYLIFDEYWGNNRGSSWTIAVKSYGKGSFIRKLLGCGPDGFSSYARSFFDKELAEKWGQSAMLTCAHNEWLNALVNLGITGAAAYIGIFVSAIRRFFKKAAGSPELIVIAISIMCYMGHNFFCYQQVVCTPTVFILMGIGEAMLRHGKAENNYA